MSVRFYGIAFACFTIAGLLACGNDDPAARPPAGNGVSECAAYWGGFDLQAESCRQCIRSGCAESHAVVEGVCPTDYTASCSGELEPYCQCLIGIKPGCGQALGTLYGCAVDACAATCEVGQ